MSTGRNTSARIRLAGRMPFASGNRQILFAHPGDPSVAIKILRPGIIPEGRFPVWSRLAARYYHAISFGRVQREFKRWHRANGQSSRFLQRVIGTVETDLGPGLAVEVERGPDGGYAPTLNQLALNGGYDRTALDRFCFELESADIVVSDLNPRNIIYAIDEDGRARFVLIDGTGDDTFIPVLRLSGMLNRAVKRRKIASLRRKVDRILEGSRLRPTRAGPSPGVGTASGEPADEQARLRS